MRTFTLSRYHRVWVAIAAMCAVAGMALVAIAWPRIIVGSASGPPVGYLGALLAAGGFLWTWLYLRRPHLAILHEGGTVEFHAVLGRYALAAEEFHWAKAWVNWWTEAQDEWLQRHFGWRPTACYYVLIRHDGGWLWVLSHLREFVELMAAVRSLNPECRATIYRVGPTWFNVQREEIEPEPGAAPPSPLLHHWPRQHQ